MAYPGDKTSAVQYLIAVVMKKKKARRIHILEVWLKVDFSQNVGLDEDWLGIT